QTTATATITTPSVSDGGGNEVQQLPLTTTLGVPVNGTYAYTFNGASPAGANSTLTVTLGAAQQETLTLGGSAAGSIKPSFRGTQANTSISRTDESQKLTISGSTGTVVLTYKVGATTYTSSAITVDSVNNLPGLPEVTTAVNSLFAAMQAGLGANLTGGVSVVAGQTVGTYVVTFNGTINPGTGVTKNFDTM